METYTSILSFWFGAEPDDAALAEERAALWWGKDLATDIEVRRRFEPCLIAARSGELDDWRPSPAGRMALILLTDQFSRNMYRDRPEAFVFDDLAHALCVDGLDSGLDQKLRPIERVFFYLPLEHAECLDDQDRSVSLFRALAREVPPAWAETFEGYTDFALRHRDIIARFGRFPHRNGILGRESTPEELLFLKGSDSGF